MSNKSPIGESHWAADCVQPAATNSHWTPPLVLPKVKGGQLRSLWAAAEAAILAHFPGDRWDRSLAALVTGWSNAWNMRKTTAKARNNMARKWPRMEETRFWRLYSHWKIVENGEVEKCPNNTYPLKSRPFQQAAAAVPFWWVRARLGTEAPEAVATPLLARSRWHTRWGHWAKKSRHDSSCRTNPSSRLNRDMAGEALALRAASIMSPWAGLCWVAGSILLAGRPPPHCCG